MDCSLAFHDLTRRGGHVRVTFTGSLAAEFTTTAAQSGDLGDGLILLDEWPAASVGTAPANGGPVDRGGGGRTGGLVVRPGPRLVDGVEAIAAILHPGAVPAPPGGTIRRVA